MQIIFLFWYKKFGPARNILGPVKGQGTKPLNTNQIPTLLTSVISHHQKISYKSYCTSQQSLSLIEPLYELSLKKVLIIITRKANSFHANVFLD